MCYKKYLFIYTIVLYFTFNTCSCEKDTTGIRDDCSPYSGITEVDYMGNIGNIDSDDWEDSGIIVSPIAYPNPVDGPYNIQFGLTETAIMQITVNNHPENVLKTIVNDTLSGGMYMLHCDIVSDIGDTMSNCIYRIYFKATSNNITYSTYGDIKIERL